MSDGQLVPTTFYFENGSTVMHELTEDAFTTIRAGIQRVWNGEDPNVGAHRMISMTKPGPDPDGIHFNASRVLFIQRGSG